MPGWKMSKTPIEIAINYSKATVERLAAMQSALLEIDRNGILGDIVECGVWRGGHIILTRLVSPHRTCWLYDTFDGMTMPTQRDVTRGGVSALDKFRLKTSQGRKWAAASVEEVRNNLNHEGVYHPHLCRFIIGDVCQTLQIFDNLPKQIALLRLDTDWYESTKVELEKLYPRLVSGGRLIVDDYNHWPACKQAVHEYFKKNGIRYADKLHPIDDTAVWMVKP
jgi:O-methyltransferase